MTDTNKPRAGRKADAEAAQLKRARRQALPLKRYSIVIEGYNPESFEAPTPSAARWRAFLMFRDSRRNLTFKDFLGMVTVLHMGGARQPIIHDPRQIDIEAVLAARGAL